jgi:hypothetical protein
MVDENGRFDAPEIVAYRVGKLEGAVKDLRSTVELHDDLLNQLRGAKALVAALGLLNIVAICGVLIALFR